MTQAETCWAVGAFQAQSGDVPGKGHPRTTLARTTAAVAVMALLASLSSHAEPGLQQLLETKDSVLDAALQYDLARQPDGMGDQKLAEKYYLEFIEKNPDSELVPYVYERLANNFSCWVTREREAAGAVRDHTKARRYFQQVVTTYPRGADDRPLLGVGLLGAMVNVAALAPTCEERINKYIDYYAFLTSIREEDLADRLWFSEWQLARMGPDAVIKQIDATVGPDWMKEVVKEPYLQSDCLAKRKAKTAAAFARGLPGTKEVARLNMVSIAESAPYPQNQTFLTQIINAFPDNECGALAREALARISSEHHTGATEQVSTGLAVLVDGAAEPGDTADGPAPSEKTRPVAAAVSRPQPPAGDSSRWRLLPWGVAITACVGTVALLRRSR